MIRTCTFVFAAAFALGCTGCSSVGYYLLPAAMYDSLYPPPPPVKPPGGEGPFAGRLLKKDELLAVLNKRAASVEVLVARLDLQAELGPRQGRHDLAGNFVAQPPQGFRLYAQLANKQVLMGSNAEQYWFFSSFEEGDNAKAIFGRWKFFGRACAQRTTLDPTQVMGVLGVFAIEEDPVRGPMISVTYSPPEFVDPTNKDKGYRVDTGCYIVRWQRWRDPGKPELGVYTERDVYVSRGTLEPYRFVFHTPDGRQVLRAEVDEKERHTVDGRSIPTRILVTVPIYGNDATVAELEQRVQFSLSDLKFDRGNIPADRFVKNFDPDTVVAPFVDKEDWQYLDRACERDGPVGPPGAAIKPPQ